MVQSIFKKLLPHLIAIATFLIVAVIYCRPALEGKVLQQNDIVHWKGMAQNAFEYKERHGKFPLWNTNLFAGMPNYQVTTEAKNFLPDFHILFTLGMPKPIAFFFLACLCFYILTLVLGIKTAVGIFASLAFAYASYDPVIIVAGHESKMWAMAYMPGVLAGLILIYQKKYWLGLAVTAVFGTWQIAVNHPQISYYLLITVGIITLGYLIEWIRAKEWKHAAIALLLAALAGFISFANSSISLLTTKEYAAYTMRGGKTLDINGSSIKQVATKGLDRDYAFSYSIARSEILTFFMPNVYGGSSGETLSDDTKFVDALVNKNIPEQSAIQLASSLPKYWGGIVEGTSGPIYFGAILCFMALIALIVVKGPLKWTLLATIVFAIFMAWGKYFMDFNTILLDYMPFYNKFRAPSISLVIPQLLIPMLAALGAQQILFTSGGKEQLQKSFKPVLYILGGLFLLTGIFYLMNDYSAGIDSQIIQAYTNPQTGDSGPAKMVVSALKESRKEMLGAGILRAFAFALLVVALLFMYLKNILKPLVVVIVLLIVNTIDLLVVDSKYLNSENYTEKDSFQSENFTPNAANAEILNDKSPHYRVFNLSPDRFSDAITSYFHRSVGGYHAAKLNIYQDLITAQLSKSPLNMPVLNMLDTRYFIIPPSEQQPGYSVHKNDSALGAAWFVKSIRFADGPVQEMEALNNFNPKDTAVVNTSFKTDIKQLPVPDSTASIKLVTYDNDAIEYETSAAGSQFAVFSEIYYPKGWNAYIDGVKAPYVKVNYVLRGMEVPAGRHKIEYKFEPSSFRIGQNLTYMGNSLLWLALLLAIFAEWKRNKKVTVS